MTDTTRNNPDIDHTNGPIFSPAHAPEWPAGVVIGFGTALAMWLAWLFTHAPAVLTGSGQTASSPVTTAAVAAAMLVAVIVGARKASGPGWLVGLIAGGVSGLVNLMLLGSILSEQVETADQMHEAANQFRDNAPMIVGGFFAVSLAAGAVAGAVGGMLRPAGQTQRPGEWVSRMAVLTVVAMLPLISIGGAVTSTESGMAVPGGVSSYGAVSVLFPLSLMAEPRIFLEHTHRLFGMLVGLHAIVLAVLAMTSGRRGTLIGVIGAVALIGVAVGAVAAERAGGLGVTGSVILTGLASVAGLGFTHAMNSRGRLAAACAGLLALVTIQGLLGIQRVDEDLIGVAMFHGLFAQIVIVTAVMIAASLSPTFSTAEGGVTPETKVLGARLFKFGLIALVLLTFQLVLGAASRHLGGAKGGAHVTLTHAANSFVVVVVVIIVAALCTKGDTQTPVGRTLKRIGGALMVVLTIQFLLGWAALGMVGIGREPRPIPLAGELAVAHAIPIGEAIVTTSHQVGGAVLYALVALAATWGRRAKRATEAELVEPNAASDEETAGGDADIGGGFADM
ncbi:MAG: heme A synthase [Phycisphaerales bacterium]|jgi:heme A synthase